jgi:predicted nucleotide-binding protein
MPTTTIFIGSSSSARSQANAVINKFTSATLQFLPWWDAFRAGGTLLERLDLIKDQVNGALFLFTPDFDATIRGLAQQVPNLNVLFEFGYFYGYLGRDKVAIMKYGDYYLPSDFGGYIHIFGSKFVKRNALAAVGKRTIKEFGQWVQNV